MKLKQLLFISLLFFSAFSFAQNKNPFQSIGKKGEILTLTKGSYEELFDQDSIQQIGTTFLNVRSMKIVSLGNDENKSNGMMDNARHTRFKSIDPLTSSYPMLTPYQFASNRPIDGIDLDGLEYSPPLKVSADGKLIVDGDAAIKIHTHKNNLIGVAIATDILITKGWATRFLLFSQVAGAFEHNRANTSERRIAQDQRSKEAIAGAAITWGTAKLFGIGMNVTSEVARLAGNRFDFAKQFYKGAGVSETDFVPHARGLDLTEKVFETTLKKGTVLEQWAYKNPATGEVKLGNYYTLPGSDPTKLGISLENRVKVSISLSEDTKFLQSTAADVKDWTGSGNTFTGGGTQLFQNTVKYEVLKTPTTQNVPNH